MIGLIQRVTRAEVRIGGRVAGAIDRGILAFVGVSRGDDAQSAERLLEKILNYRIFPDSEGRVHRLPREALTEVGGMGAGAPQFVR